MKKLNKKGFTLIELLVVIVILVVIMAIAIPSVNSSIERSKEKQVSTKQKLILSAAELYVDSHRNSITGTGKDIYIKDLICNGLLTKEEAKDPFNETRTLCGYVRYTKSNNELKWHDQECRDNYTVNINDNLSC